MPSFFFFRRLRHPNIVMLFGHVITDNDILIVMSYIKGCNLAAALGLVQSKNAKVRNIIFHNLCSPINSFQNVK